MPKRRQDGPPWFRGASLELAKGNDTHRSGRGQIVLGPPDEGSSGTALSWRHRRLPAECDRSRRSLVIWGMSAYKVPSCRFESGYGAQPSRRLIPAAEVTMLRSLKLISVALLALATFPVTAQDERTRDEIKHVPVSPADQFRVLQDKTANGVTPLDTTARRDCNVTFIGDCPATALYIHVCDGPNGQSGVSNFLLQQGVFDRMFLQRGSTYSGSCADNLNYSCPAGQPLRCDIR
jgi:hypothetical protein